MITQTLSRLLLLCVLLCTSSVFADTQRPKIGLVLGGGGAAGTAHVGVLKVLEENQIPIDMIAGTSMGAIVGSLYASGLKATEIEKIVNTLDWAELFNDQVSRRDQSFHRKQEMSSFFDSFTVGANRNGVQLPRGAVKGQKLTFELRRLLDHVSHIQNFDQLPIPFRAVATDIENGQAVVLSQGNLPTSVRASMSIPGLFPPVEINGRLLVDGFVANNIPVNIAQQMGADILIVVGIPTEYKNKQELGSALDIALQSMRLMMAKSSTPQLQNISQPHIIIQPNMDGIGSLDFDRVKDAMTLGEKQARAQEPELLKLTEGLRGKVQQQTATAPTRESFKGVIDSIKLENSSVLKDEILTKRLGLKAGDVLSLKKLQEGLDAIYALGYFEVVDYQLIPTKDNHFQLIVNAQKDPIGDRTLRGGFSLSDDFDGNATYQAGLEYSMKGLNPLGGEAKASVIIGDSTALSAEFFQPLNKYSGSFWNLTTNYQESDVFIYEDGSSVRTAEARLAESGVHLDFGREFDNTSEARIGLFYRNLDATLKTGSIEFPSDSFNLAGLSFEYHEDTLNDRNFPDEGLWKDVTLDLGLSALGSDDDYQRLDIQMGKAWKKDKHHFIASASAGTTFADDTIITERFELGGFARMSGLEDGQLRGNHYAHGVVSYYYDVIGLSKIANVNAGVLLEAGNTWIEAGDIDPSDLKLSGAAFLGANTLIGPAYLGVGMTEGYNQRYFLQFGRAF
ncbi:patatin-like phospholipase family protein [Leucothrix mucor]|uniref:patatin-like phospholipase family protein n=1 Tax=Leucothrix mucor TaxID=45248 RepID=UPI00040E3E76|nr:patatin-like phospholipase family protein [Leucothrix mucor]